METRTVEVVVPADPANLDSEAKVRGLGIWDCSFSWLSHQEGVLGGRMLGSGAGPWPWGRISPARFLWEAKMVPHGFSSSSEGDKSLGILPAFRLRPCHCV